MSYYSWSLSISGNGLLFILIEPLSFLFTVGNEFIAIGYAIYLSIIKKDILHRSQVVFIIEKGKPNSQASIEQKY
jgi:hypothetical protein